MLLPRGLRAIEVMLVSVALGCPACGSDVFTVAAEGGTSDASAPSDASDASDASTDVIGIPDAKEPPLRDAALADGDVSGGTAKDGGPGTNPSLLECGSTSCTIGGGKQACCVSSKSTGTNYEFACVATTDACNDPPLGGNQVFMRCGGRPFCTGSPCCLRRDTAPPGHFTTFCNATCPVEICALGGPLSACAAGDLCVRPSSPAFDMLPGGYGSCGGRIP